MKSRYRLSITDEILASELRYAVSIKYIPEFGDVNGKKKVKKS